MCMRATALYLALACVLSLCLLPACEDTATPPLPVLPPEIERPEVITVLARAYNEKDANLLATLLASEPGAEYVHQPCGLSGETPWGSAEEIRILQRRLYPLPGLPLLPGEQQLQDFRVTFTRLEDFTERPDLYSADGGLDGKLDPQRWRAVDARHSTDVFLDLAGTDYRVEGEANFVVIQDRTKQPDDPGALLLYRWEEICESP